LTSFLLCDIIIIVKGNNKEKNNLKKVLTNYIEYDILNISNEREENKNEKME
jgi:hypothetical protein